MSLSFLLINTTLSIIVSIYCYLIKCRLLSHLVINNKLEEVAILILLILNVNIALQQWRRVMSNDELKKIDINKIEDINFDVSLDEKSYKNILVLVMQNFNWCKTIAY